MIEHLLPHLSTQRSRLRAYNAITILLLIVAIGLRAYVDWRAHQPFNLISSDGRGLYVYLPSLVIDGDLDFSNQMLETYGSELTRWDYDVNDRTETGLVQNKYPIGMALTLTAPFLIAHGAALTLHHITGSEWFTPDGYSLPYQLMGLLFILVVSNLTMRLIDQLIERHFRIDGRAIGAAVIFFWLGSHYVWYCFREPFMVHVVSCFWMTLVIYACVRIWQRATLGRLGAADIFMLSGAMTMAMLCRPSNAFVLPIIFWSLAGVWQAGLIGKFVRALPLAMIGLLPLAAQVQVWHAMHGRWLYPGYGDEHFVWMHPALLQTLFSLQKGLFVWTPLLLLAVIGIIQHLRKPDATGRGLIICWLMAAAILWYLNSAWWFWGFGQSFGARAFLELAGLFVLGLSVIFDWAIRRSHHAIFALAVGLSLYTYVLMGLCLTNRIGRGNLAQGAWSPAGAPAKVLQRRNLTP